MGGERRERRTTSDQAALAEDEDPLLWRALICVEVSHAGASMRERPPAGVLAACCGGARPRSEGRLRCRARGRLPGMSIPPDRPTERLQPQPPPQPIVEERYAVPAADPNVVLLRIEDSLASLRTGLMIVGVIAVAALGVAIYALMKEDDAGTNSRSGLASDARVSQLDDRIDRLSRQVQAARSDASGGGEAAAVDDRVAALEKTVKTLADRPAPGDATQAVNELSDRIDDVTADVEQLKTAQTP